MAYARGKYAKAISDRSGMAFPYNEMVKEWNGSFVHKSEYEAKHPQIRRKHIKADAIALANARPSVVSNVINAERLGFSMINRMSSQVTSCAGVPGSIGAIALRAGR